MDGSKFKERLSVWYESVKMVSDWPWMRSLNSRAGHEALSRLHNVTYGFLPPDITACFQSLDQRLISISEIAHKFCLLRKCTEGLPLMATTANPSGQNAPGRGKLRLVEVHLPHVADAMAITDSAWINIDRSSITNC